MTKLAVVIPALNEERSLPKVLAKIPGRDALVDEWMALDKLKPASYSAISYENGRVFYKKTLGGEKEERSEPPDVGCYVSELKLREQKAQHPQRQSRPPFPAPQRLRPCRF